MALETKPAIEVGKNYVPANSSRYHYIAGESFVTIAEKFGIADPWDLIFFNFKTRQPREVNWYLRHYCGCTKTTHDGHNYLFASTDRRDGMAGFIYIPTTVIDMEPLTIVPRSGIWFGLGVKVNAGAGAEISPVHAYMFSADRYADQFGVFVDAATIDIGGNFSIGAVVLIACGVRNPQELEGFIYDGGWEIQLQLGENWGKIFKFLKGTRKMGPLVKAFNKIAGKKLSTVIATLRKQGSVGKGLASVVRNAVLFTRAEWEELRQAVKLGLGALDIQKYKESPALQVLEVPFLSGGVALGYSNTLGEVHVHSVSFSE